MGMFIGFFLLIYILVAIGVYKLTKRFSQQKWVHRMVLATLILIPTYDIIITNTLGAYHCLTTPSSYISKKVENPESIYWEDNVYPGFNEEDRKLMITNYLDGKHLKTMALNGDDGKVYVYTLESPMWEEIKHEFNNEKTLEKARNKYVELIVHEEHIYTKDTMPKTNYTVTFDEVKLNPLSRMFLYSDETKIMDNNTNETIAYNRRVMRFFYNVFPDLVLGNRYYQQDSVCGSNTQYFFQKIFQKIFMNTGAIAESFNSKLYKTKGDSK